MTWRLLRAPALLVFPLALLAGACTERLETADGCPLLCPGQTLEIRDTILDPAYVFDTTLAPFPITGAESPLLLVSRGDTLDVRPIFRFDTLARVFTPVGDTARPVTMVDSVTLTVRLIRTPLKVPQTFFVDAYDVTDTSLVDSLPSTLIPLFTAGRLLGSKQIDSATFLDTMTVQIPLDTAMVRAIVTSPNAPLRIGLRLRSTESGAFYVASNEDLTDAFRPRLRYRVSPDTVIAAANISPRSGSPVTPLHVAGDYNDYTLVADAPDIRRATTFAIGGLSAARTYMRFDLPRFLTDSTAVLRASLELVQDPVYGLDEADSVVIRPQMVLAGHAITDLNRAARLLAREGTFVTDSLRVAPGDSGIVSLEINGLFRAWRKDSGLPDIPSAIVLRSDNEGFSGFGARFFGMNAAPALRPRLKVSYVLNIKFGQP